jgi:hypothetical protein
LIAEHVEEQAVHVVSIERLTQDLHGVLAIVAAVDAGIEPVVITTRSPCGRTLRTASKTFRLVEIESADPRCAASARWTISPKFPAFRKVCAHSGSAGGDKAAIPH